MAMKFRTWSVLVLLVLCAYSARAQVVSYEWVQRQGSTDADGTYAIATDGSGSSYFCGSFSGAVNFGAPISARANAIAVGPNGDVYVSGLTRDTAKLFPNDSVANQMFVARYDTSGNRLWSIRSHARQSAIATGIGVAPSGKSIYIS